jgi:hypothetical protein
VAISKWNTPSAQGSNIAGATLDSLASGSTSAFVSYDNSSNLDLYADVEVDLGSITPGTGGAIVLRVFATANAGASVPDNTGSVGGGDTYTAPLLAGTGTKIVTFPLVRLYPFAMRLCVTNNAGVALAASGNAIKVQPYNEQVI